MPCDQSRLASGMPLPSCEESRMLAAIVLFGTLLFIYFRKPPAGDNVAAHGQ